MVNLTEMILISPEKCTGCRICEMACSLHNAGQCNPAKSRIRVLKKEIEGLDVPFLCQHCEDAPCREVCPTGAIYNRYRTHYAVKGHSKEWDPRESFCPECGLLCPAVYFVRDNSLLKIEGNLSSDESRPDRGQLCYKGRFETFKTEERRLLHPMVRGEDGNWIEETWEGALDLVVKGLNTIKEESGNDSLFGIVSSQCSNEELVFFKDLMSESWDAGYINTLHAARFGTIPKVWKGLEKTYREASWRLIPDSDFILVLGANPYQSQPVISSLIRRNVMEKGSELGVIGSIDSMYPLTSYYVPVKPEDESLLIKAILSEVIGSVKEPTSSVILPLPQISNWKRISDEVEKMNVRDTLEKSGIDEDAGNAFHAIVRAFIKSKSPIIIAGEELTALESFSGLRLNAGMKLTLGVLTIHADYTKANYSVITAGLGISFR